MKRTPEVLVRLRYYGPKARNREWYSSSTGGGDYLNYVDTGSKAGKYYDYVQYAGNREKSSGVFSRGGLLSFEQKKELRSKLRQTGSKIWDCVISFEEAYGKRLMTGTDRAVELLNAVLPKFFRDNGMPYDNMEWFAGLHENTDNRHIHLCFFERGQTRWKCKHSGKHWHKGKLLESSMADLKLRIDQELKGLSAPDRRPMKEAIRKADISETVDQEFKGKVLEIYRSLTEDGKAWYGSRSMDETRPLVDEATDIAIASDPELWARYSSIRKRLKERDEEARRYAQRNSITKPIPSELQAFERDVRTRMGNKVVKLCVEAARQKVETDASVARWKRERWDEKRKRHYLFAKAIALHDRMLREATECFDEFERRMKRIEWQRKMEEEADEEAEA